ncbi:MOSC domain-containing protein [Nitratifractor sp.]
MILAGEVLGTFSAPEGTGGLPRPRVETLRLRAEYGIEGDKFAGKNPDRGVLITGKYAYDLAQREGIELAPGSLGENLLLDFDPHRFTIGTVFEIGGARIRVSESCTLCDHLAVFDKRLPRLVRDNRGLYCRVLRDGEIRPGDSVVWIGREW